MNFKNEIFNHLKSVEFRKDKLAFLTLTGKTESNIRDEVAFRLHEKYDGKYRTGREVSIDGKKADMAILKDGEPVCIVEFKAMYTFDGAGGSTDNPHKLLRDLKKDIERWEEIRKNGTHVYGVMLAIHPKSEIPESSKGIVKYTGNIDRSFRMKTESEISASCEDMIDKFFDKNDYQMGTINAGRCWDIPVEILYWVIEPEYVAKQKKLKIE